MTPCELYTGTVRYDGYGTTQLGGKQRLAHRIAFAIGHGVDPAGMVVRHKCDNPTCVNPDHLELGTVADNMRDKRRSGVVAGERNPGAVMSEQDVRGVRALMSLGVRDFEIAPIVGVSRTVIGRIRDGRNWGHIKW